MLFTNMVALANAARLNMLELRHLELDLYTTNARSIAVKAVLIGAIGWSALVYTKKDYYQLADQWFLHIYPAVGMLVVGYSLLAVVQFNLIALMAPGLALRGPDGSVHLAVEGLMIEYRAATYWFAQSIFWTVMLLLVYAWGAGIYRTQYAKISLTVVAGGAILAIFVQTRSIARQFAASSVVSGAFYPHDAEMLDRKVPRGDEAGGLAKHMTEMAKAQHSAQQRRMQGVLL
mmetsp:Transcript_19241/g.44941  ORF Transcript_19241/g.44941 Transcript_19241/m.44941 type:complete len:232 (+) Transcript_19241:43-738(+)